MLVPSPRHQRIDPNANLEDAPEAATEVFGAAVSRDLTQLRIIAFEAPIGGRMKRALDFMIVMLTAPFWLSAFLFVLARRKMKRCEHTIIGADCIGYGGRYFTWWMFDELQQPSDIGLTTARIGPAQNSVARSSGVIAGLPTMFNVLLGQMSLVGPKPLSRQAFEALHGRRKFYASARPGLIDAFEGLGAAKAHRSPYRNFSFRWTASGDVAIAWRAMIGAMQRSKKAGRAARASLQAVAAPQAAPEILED